jgi:hypothetical protein
MSDYLKFFWSTSLFKKNYYHVNQTYFSLHHRLLLLLEPVADPGYGTRVLLPPPPFLRHCRSRAWIPGPPPLLPVADPEHGSRVLLLRRGKDPGHGSRVLLLRCCPLQIPSMDPRSSSSDVAKIPGMDPGSSSSNATLIMGTYFLSFP